MADKLTANEKTYLLSLARNAIKHYFKTGRKLEIKPGDVNSKRIIEDGASFVTMHIGKALRGCIGSLEAKRPLVFDVVDNAINSAFGDPRFYELKPEELPKVKFSISVLTKPERLNVTGPEDLLEKLIPHKHGLIIQYGLHRATYLPVVWGQLPDKVQFLNELCQKAGLPQDAWKEPDMEFYIYEAEEFEEELR